MNKNIDLTKILKNCPKGWKLYSSAFGEVEFQYIELGSVYPIIIKLKTELIKKITSNGKLLDLYDVECTLFPSKDCRDWSKFTAPWYKKKPKFDPKTLQPFDKVLVRSLRTAKWRCEHFSYFKEGDEHPYMASTSYAFGVPYNEDTKHLVGTSDEAPEFYRYWED